MIDWENWDWSGPPPTEQEMAEVRAHNLAVEAAAAEAALNPVLAAESALWAALTANPLTPHLNPGA
jgi:hypothetical protein